LLEQKVLDAYADGSELGLIITSFNITHKQVIDILHRFKEDNRQKKSFKDDFKIMVAQRDINGVARSTIAKELEINPNTVKKFCEQFGQALKEKSAMSEKAFTRIDGEFDLKSCPSCNSKKVNVVEENTTYCMKCGNEHIINEDHALKINFEYIEE
jgi:transposase-like protein